MPPKTQAIVLTPQDEADFQEAFPNHTPEKKDEETEIDFSGTYSTIKENTKLLKKADKIIFDRMKDSPESISFKDAIAVKAEANRQINAEKGIADDGSGPRIIPSVINIQIINN